MVNRVIDIRSYIREKSTPYSCGCWLWNDGLNPSGYGVLGLKGRNQRAHRVSFEEFNGPIPEGMQVLHRCDIKSCVNPMHLYVGTVQDNANDRMKAGKGRAPRVEYCKYGHPTKDLSSRNKWGYCLICYQAYKKRQLEEYYRRKAQNA